MPKSAVAVRSLPVNTCIPHFSINLMPVHLKQQRYAVCNSYLPSQHCIGGYWCKSILESRKYWLEVLIVLVQIKSFAELPVLLDEQFREDNKCDHCGSLQNIDLFLSNTPHFFTIVLNWLGGSESQDALSEVLAGITSPLDTEFFCRSAHSAAMYAVTSMAKLVLF